MRPLLAALLAAVLAGCASGQIRGLSIDHIILAAPNLADGSAEFERLTGVKPTYGGQHPDRGTENAIVALDNFPASYIEIIAPQAGVTPAGELAEIGKLRALTPIGWALRVDDVADARRVIRKAGFTTTQPQPGSRVTPDRFTLRWETFGVEKPHINTAPFFIHWMDPTDHPSRNAPRGCALRELYIADPNEPALHRLLSKIGLQGIRSKSAPTTQIAVDLLCRRGEVLLPTE